MTADDIHAHVCQGVTRPVAGRELDALLAGVHQAARRRRAPPLQARAAGQAAGAA